MTTSLTFNQLFEGGRYHVKNLHTHEVWELYIKKINGNKVICDWTNTTTGFVVKDHQDSYEAMVKMEQQKRDEYQCVCLNPPLPEDLFTL